MSRTTPGGGGGDLPRPTKCQSEGGPALTKMRGGVGRVPPQKNVSLRGAGVDLPECQERRRGKHKGTKKSVFFFGVKASPAKGRRRLQKNTDGLPGKGAVSKGRSPGERAVSRGKGVSQGRGVSGGFNPVDPCSLLPLFPLNLPPSP